MKKKLAIVVIFDLILENQNLPREERKGLEAKLNEREDFLDPMYQQAAVKFADLHDTPGGMLAKGCVSVSALIAGSEQEVLSF